MQSEQYAEVAALHQRPLVNEQSIVSCVVVRSPCEVAFTFRLLSSNDSVWSQL